MKKNPLFTVKETAVILGMSAGTIYNRMAIGAKRPFEIKPVRVGRSIKFRREDVEKLVNGQMISLEVAENENLIAERDRLLARITEINELLKGE